MTGFLKNISHTYDDNSPWETETGKRVPKYIISTIGFQVIHMTTPNLDFATGGDDTFYGYGKEEFNVPLTNVSSIDLGRRIIKP